MSVVKGILLEELDRLEKLQAKYASEQAKLPSCSLRRKKIGKQVYLYHVSRQNGKVVTKYLCKSVDPQAAQFEEQDARRRELKAKLKKLQKDIEEVGRSLGKVSRNRQAL